LRKMIKMP